MPEVEFDYKQDY